MVEEAARDSHTMLMVAICHLLVRLPHQIDQHRGLKSIHLPSNCRNYQIHPQHLVPHADRWGQDDDDAF